MTSIGSRKPAPVRRAYGDFDIGGRGRRMAIPAAPKAELIGDEANQRRRIVGNDHDECLPGAMMRAAAAENGASI